MKHLTFIFFITTLISCSSEEQQAEVNFIGTWNYTLTTQNSVCDGFEAKGIVVYTSLNGDLTKLGDSTIQGEGLDLKNTTNCIFITVDQTDTSIQGDPSTLTYSQFITDFEQEVSDSTNIVSGRVDSFSSSNITEVIEHIDGYTLIFSITR